MQVGVIKPGERPSSPGMTGNSTLFESPAMLLELLPLPEFAVERTAFLQLFIRPIANHHAPFKNQDAVHNAKRAETMRDDEDRLVPRQFQQGLLHKRLIIRIQSRGSLVQHQDGRLAQEGPGQGQTLPLPP